MIIDILHVAEVSIRVISVSGRKRDGTHNKKSSSAVFNCNWGCAHVMSTVEDRGHMTEVQDGAML